MTAAARRLFPVATTVTTSGPRYAPGSTLRSNAETLAQWLWGERRAQWCADLADDLARMRPVTRYAPHSQEWVAAILSAAAVDAGRNQRPSTWARTVAGISQLTEVPRDTVLARWTELSAIGLSRPSGVRELWQKDA